MIAYFIKTICCSIILLLVYLLLLQGEKMYRFNRFYLLFSIVVSFLIPLIPVTTNMPLPTATEIIPAVADYTIFLQPTATTAIETPVNTWLILLIGSYITVTAFLLCRFIINLLTLYRTIRNNDRTPLSYTTMVLAAEAITPYSFLHYIFVNKEEYENGETNREILKHELTHVKQKHSLDILLLEFLLIFCWINPFLFLYRKAIQLNHELLADESVINTFHDIPAYQQLLLHTLSRGKNALSSPFNYLITKKRLIMMNKPGNHRTALLKQVMLLPVLVGMVFLFSTKTYAQQPAQKPAQQPSQPTVTPQSKQAGKAPAFTPPSGKRPLINSFAMPLIPDGPGATTAELAEYDAEMNRIATKAPDERGVEITSIDMKAANKNRIAELYKKMNGAQRKVHGSEIGAVFVYFTTPATRPALTTEHLVEWSDATKYALWIDHRKVDNDALKNYQPSDFINYMENRVYSTPQKKISYSVEVNLYTKSERIQAPADILKMSKR